MRTNLIILLLLAGSVSQAQIDMTYRRQNAVVLYEFNETSGNQVLDTANASFGSPINLTIADPSAGAVARGTTGGDNYLELVTRNLIQSSGAATKLLNACRPASGDHALTIEAWFENNDPAQPSVGEFPGGTPQPNRIVNFGSASDIRRNNFYMGQFYDNAEFLYSAINTSGNEGAAPGGSLNNSIRTNMNQVIIPALESANPPAVNMQKMFVTLSQADRTARMYLSDREGNVSIVAPFANGFGVEGGKGLFSDWYADGVLTIGNVASTATEVQNAPAAFRTCVGNVANNDATCRAKSRYWKGKIYMVAIYCRALSEEQIIGSRANATYRNPVIPIDVNTVINDQRLKAQEIFQRITSVKTPIYDPVLTQMVERLNANDPIGAARIATNDPRFYNITVRDFASKMSNRPETINVPLNDFTATVIGVVRDELNAQKLLTDNLVYRIDTSKAAVPANLVTDILRSNNHYQAADTQRLNLGDVLTRFEANGSTPLKQKIFDGVRGQDMPTPAGLLTSRSWLESHAIAGTNRRLVEYTFRAFHCTPLENVADSNGPDNVVGVDIDRFPGGSHTKFTTTCRACHTVMDSLRPAWSYFTFNSNYVMHAFTNPSVATQGAEDLGQGMFKSDAPGASYVARKINHNVQAWLYDDRPKTYAGNNTPVGRITTDDNWSNNAIYGANASYFTWKQTSGKGIQAYGQMFADSKQYPTCMAKRIYASVCKREPASSETEFIKNVATEFSATQGYNLKWLFQKIVTSRECLGGQ